MAAPEVCGSRAQWSSALCSCCIVLALLLLAQLAEGAGVSSRTRGLQEEGEAVYCVAKLDADAGKLQEALDWACGEGTSLGSVDCKAIQSGGTCFEPDTVAGHASYAFTLYYYQQSAASHACDFKGLATLTYTNPSSGTCVYPTSTQQSTNSSDSSPSTGESPPNPLYIFSPAPSPNGARSHHAVFFGTLSLLCVLPLVMTLV